MSISQKPPLADFVQRTWPGTTALQWAGFMSNGSGNEDTCSVPNQKFHEIGYFGTTAGPCTIDYAPNTSRERENNWVEFYNDSLVKSLLGRDACMTRDCWKESNGGFADQCAVGLVSMLAKQRAFVRQVPAGVKPQQLASKWSLACTFAVWSAGLGGLLKHLRPLYDRLGAIPEADRWDGFRKMLAEGIANGSVPVGPRKSHANNPAYTVLRTQQKLAAATQNYRDDVYDIIITKAAYGVAPSEEYRAALRSGGALVPVVTPPPPAPPPAPGSPPAPPSTDDSRDNRLDLPTASIAGAVSKNIPLLVGALSVAAVVGVYFWTQRDN